VIRRRLRGGDEGSSLIEFVGATIILLVPLVYVLLSVFSVQRASFGVSEAAREAGRAFATAPDATTGMARATYAAGLAMGDQGVAGAPTLVFTAAGTGCHAAPVTPGLLPGASYTVCVLADVHLPYADRGVLRHVVPATVHVVGSYTLVVDRFRST
jgi:Flp pilus assembly protein TadG